jgi:hypothetical protein
VLILAGLVSPVGTIVLFLLAGKIRRIDTGEMRPPVHQ